VPIKEILHISKEKWLNERTKLGQIQEKSTYGPSFTVEGSQRFFLLKLLAQQKMMLSLI